MIFFFEFQSWKCSGQNHFTHKYPLILSELVHTEHRNGCPERLWNLPVWRCSNPMWMCSSVICSKWSCVGWIWLFDLHWSLPTPTNLWFCDFWKEALASCCLEWAIYLSDSYPLPLLADVNGPALQTGSWAQQMLYVTQHSCYIPLLHCNALPKLLLWKWVSHS